MASFVLAVGLAASALIPPDRATATVLAGTNDSVLTRPPQLQPGTLGDGSAIGLQYADPAEQMVMMDPPQASNQGGAGLAHPLLIPAGRVFKPTRCSTTTPPPAAAGSARVGISPSARSR